MTSKIGEYKGRPIITLSDGDKPFPFSFGLRKARILLAHIQDIKAFVESHGGVK